MINNGMEEHHKKFSECLRQIDSEIARAIIDAINCNDFDIIYKGFGVYKIPILQVVTNLGDRDLTLAFDYCHCHLREEIFFTKKGQNIEISRIRSTSLTMSDQAQNKQTIEYEPIRQYVKDLILRHEYQHE